MIEKLIEYSIRNRFLVLLVAAALAVFAVYAVLQHAGGRHPRPEREPGHRLHRLDGPQSAGDRGPDHLSAVAQAPGTGRRQGGALVVGVQLLDDYASSSRTTSTSTSPASACWSSSTLASTFLPRGRGALPRPRRHRAGPDLLVHRSKAATSTRAARWALQKFYVGPELNSVPGVAEVGTVGGMPLEYQIDVDPNALRAYGVTLGELYDAVARSNSAVGGRVIQKNNAEYLVRGVGWIENTQRHREHGRQGGRAARRSTSRTWPRCSSARSFAAASSRRTATRSSAAWW